MERIWIVGSAGTGKSTLGRALSARLAIAHTELDSLYWRPGWQTTPLDEFVAAIDTIASGPRWIVCGNYRRATSSLLLRADNIVWLDYPLPVTFARLLRRTLARAWTHEELWGTGNRERWQEAFLSSDSLLLYALRTHRSRRANFRAMMEADSSLERRWLRFTSPKATAGWLQSLPSP